MPAIGTIAIADGKTTPTTHTFAPVTSNGQKARWANRAASIPQGFETLIVEVKSPASATAAYVVEGSLNLPTVATVETVDSVVRQNKVDFRLNFSQTSTAQDRKDALALLKNLFANADMVTAVQNVEPFY